MSDIASEDQEWRSITVHEEGAEPDEMFLEDDPTIPDNELALSSASKIIKKTAKEQLEGLMGPAIGHADVRDAIVDVAKYVLESNPDKRAWQALNKRGIYLRVFLTNNTVHDIIKGAEDLGRGAQVSKQRELLCPPVTRPGRISAFIVIAGSSSGAADRAFLMGNKISGGILFTIKPKQGPEFKFSAGMDLGKFLVGVAFSNSAKDGINKATAEGNEIEGNGVRIVCSVNREEKTVMYIVNRSAKK